MISFHLYLHLIVLLFDYKMSMKNLPLMKNILNRGSYMSAHVLLNLLNELGKVRLDEHFISFSQRV